VYATIRAGVSGLPSTGGESADGTEVPLRPPSPSHVLAVLRAIPVPNQTYIRGRQWPLMSPERVAFPQVRAVFAQVEAM